MTYLFKTIKDAFAPNIALAPPPNVFVPNTASGKARYQIQVPDTQHKEISQNG